jgi:hypothetical protein
MKRTLYHRGVPVEDDVVLSVDLLLCCRTGPKFVMSDTAEAFDPLDNLSVQFRQLTKDLLRLEK